MVPLEQYSNSIYRIAYDELNDTLNAQLGYDPWCVLLQDLRNEPYEECAWKLLREELEHQCL